MYIDLTKEYNLQSIRKLHERFKEISLKITKCRVKNNPEVIRRRYPYLESESAKFIQILGAYTHFHGHNEEVDHFKEVAWRLYEYFFHEPA